jgi:hypothetical protein
MPRGFIWGLYIDDKGVGWKLRVDADLALQLQRGWVEVEPGELYPFPRQWIPRAVMGLGTNGQVQFAIVARVDADLWTGARQDFDIERSDGGIDTCLVVRLNAERSYF